MLGALAALLLGCDPDAGASKQANTTMDRASEALDSASQTMGLAKKEILRLRAENETLRLENRMLTAIVGALICGPADEPAAGPEEL